MKSKLIVSIFLCSFFSLTIKAQSIIEKGSQKVYQIEEDATYVRLKDATYYLKDDGRFTPEQILSGDLDSLFLPIGDLSFPADDSVKYWGRTSLISKSESEIQDFFFAFVGRLGRIELFETNDGRINVKQTGKWIPYYDRASVPPPPLRFHGFYVPLINDSLQTFRFRVTHIGGALKNSRVHPYLYCKLCMHRWVLKIDKKSNLYFGIILGLWAMAFSLFIFIRKRVYLFYLLYLSFIGVYLFMMEGNLQSLLLQTIFKNHPMGIEYLFLIFFLIAIAYISFIRTTIDLKNLLPFWNRLFKILIWAAGAFMLFSVFWMPVSNYNPEHFFFIFGIYIIPCLLATTVFLIPLYRIKSKLKIFVMLGILSLNIGSAVLIFKMLTDSFQNSDIIWMQLGAGVEIIIFAVGLGFRHRILEKEKQQIQSLLNQYLSQKNDFSGVSSDTHTLFVKSKNKTDGFLEIVLSIIKQNIENQTFGVEELARKSGFSRSQLHRKITESAGLSANQSINQTHPIDESEKIVSRLTTKRLRNCLFRWFFRSRIFFKGF